MQGILGSAQIYANEGRPVQEHCAIKVDVNLFCSAFLMSIAFVVESECSSWKLCVFIKNHAGEDHCRFPTSYDPSPDAFWDSGWRK